MSHLRVGGVRLEYAWHGPPPDRAPTLVFLHEGLGCVAMWRDFPAELAARTGCGALVYSRLGYGESDPVTPPRSLRYMHEEGLTMLPRVLAAAGIRDTVLVGHSDGASIALIAAGAGKVPEAKGLVLEAPHVFVEPIGIASITRAREAYEHGDLKARLVRHHGANTEGAFWGWNRAWLDPGFLSWNLEEYLPGVTAPVLVVQGEDDEYGTLAQVRAIEERCRGRVERVILPACGHAPHRDQREATLQAMTDFVTRLFDGKGA